MKSKKSPDLIPNRSISPVKMRCVVCGRTEELDNSHVKDNSEFDDHEDDRSQNIIYLCPTHHRMFDNNKIGICPSKKKIVIKRDGNFECVRPEFSIEYIKQEYVGYHNSNCGPRLRAALGLIPEQEYAKIC